MGTDRAAGAPVGPGESARTANLLGALALVLADRMTGSIAEASGLSPSAAAALSALDQFLERPTVDDVAGVLGLTPSGAVRLVDRLVADGLVERRQGPDRRSRSVVLTPAGRRTAVRVGAARAAALHSVLARVPDDDLSLVTRAAEALLPAVVEVKDGGAWTCRLCDLSACHRADGRCPTANAAAAKYG